MHYVCVSVLITILVGNNNGSQCDVILDLNRSTYKPDGKNVPVRYPENSLTY